MLRRLTAGTNFILFRFSHAAGAVFFLLLFAVTLLCGYEISAVYVSAGRSASRRYSPSAFFFGVSAIALGINMLFICKMVFHGEHAGGALRKFQLLIFVYTLEGAIFAQSACILLPSEMIV